MSLHHAYKPSILFGLVVLALAFALPALADAPTVTESPLHLEFVDTTSCGFPVAVVVDGTRRTTTFANGDVTRHVNLTVAQTANGHSDVETDEFEVFISAADPENWKITGRFGQVKVDGKLVYLQSGLIGYDPVTGLLTDPHLGPLGDNPDLCTALAA